MGFAAPTAQDFINYMPPDTDQDELEKRRLEEERLKAQWDPLPSKSMEWTGLQEDPLDKIVAESPRDLLSGAEPAINAASFLGGPVGAAAGIADVEASAHAENRDPAAWERGLGLLGAVPLAGGFIRKIGHVPVSIPEGLLKRGLEGVTSGWDFIQGTPIDPRLHSFVPQIQSQIDRLVREYPEVSAGLNKIDVVDNPSRYNIHSNIMEVGPLHQMPLDYQLRTGRGGSLAEAGRHEGLHALDRAAGDAIGSPSLFTDLLTYGAPGGLDPSQIYHGLRLPTSRFDPPQELHSIVSEARRSYPELFKKRYLEQLWDEYNGSGLKYSPDIPAHNLIPTETAATMFENPGVLEKLSGWKELVEMMRDAIQRDQRSHRIDTAIEQLRKTLP